MRQHRVLLALVIFSLTAFSCGGTAPAQDADTAAQGTMQALTAQAASAQTEVAKKATATVPAPTTGSIAGQVTQDVKSPYIRVVAFQVGSDQYFSLDIQPTQTYYQIDNLPPGKYRVLAYTAPSQFTAPATGAYTQYVTCGMGSGCIDHTLIEVDVVAGQVRANTDLLDRFQMPDYPADPLTVAEDSASNPSPGELSGSISGTLMYPSSAIPAMAVIAFNAENINEYYFVTTIDGQSTYQIDNLPEGSYHVVAYTLGGNGSPGGLAGGYTPAVECGLTVACTDHTLIPVKVSAGTVNDTIVPGDFYAPEGAFPPYPLQ